MSMKSHHKRMARKRIYQKFRQKLKAQYNNGWIMKNNRYMEAMSPEDYRNMAKDLREQYQYRLSQINQ